MCFDSCWPGKLLCTRRSERHMKPSTWVSITWAFFERPQQIKFWFKWIRHVLGMRSDKVSWNCRVWGTRHFNNHDPWGWIEPPFKFEPLPRAMNLYHEQWTSTISVCSNSCTTSLDTARDLWLNEDAQTVDGHLGSYNTITYCKPNASLFFSWHEFSRHISAEQHIHQTSSNEGDVSMEVLLSQINAVITRPRTCRLDDPLKKSARRTALAVSPWKWQYNRH